MAKDKELTEEEELAALQSLADDVIEEDEELPESPALVDYSVETAPAPSGGVTYVREKNGKLIPHYE
jgi:hypothetical protein